MNFGSLTQQILRLGLSVVLDFGLWARSERDEMRPVDSPLRRARC